MIRNFYSYNPTKILFGRGMTARIAAELQDVRRILLVCGGGSIRDHIYPEVRQALTDFDVVEFWGIQPNPEYETCLQAVKLSRAEKVDFILAVGGGSVMDAAKFIALVHYSPVDPWLHVIGEAAVEHPVLPVGCVVTLPASGSEANNAFVLSRRELCAKRSFFHLKLFPRFSVLDPTFTLSLPRHQTALGIVDMFVHVLEQYATYPVGACLQERQAEAILSTLVEAGPRLLERLDDYELRATVMWCGSQALNGFISRGVPTDWATHAIGHEITALYDLPHAQTLALILGGVWRYNFSYKAKMLAQYWRRVWNGSEADDETAAYLAIEATETFFEALGVSTRFSRVNLNADEVAAAVAEHLAQCQSFQPLGEHRNIDIDAVCSIIRMQA